MPGFLLGSTTGSGGPTLTVMRPDNDDQIPRDYFMPKPSPWRWVGLVLFFGVLVACLVALVRLAVGL